MDGTFIFGQATCSETAAWKVIFNDYCAASGQRINADKLSVFYSSNVKMGREREYYKNA